MFRCTASSCRAVAGTFALIGFSISALADQPAPSAAPPLPATSLGEPQAPPAPGSKATKPPAKVPGPALPAPSAPPQPSSAQPAPVPADPSQSVPPAPGLPGLGGLMTPNGIAIPGGVGFIRPGADSVGIQINTPDGPIEFTVPRRHRDRRPQQAIAPEATTDAPLFGQPGKPAPSAVPQAGFSAPAIENEPRVPGESNAPDVGRSTRGSREFAHASRLFHARNYPLVLRRLDRALIRDPGDRDLLQLRSLTQLALADYKSASVDALVVLAQDDVWDWSTLRSLYHSVDEYTALYRALEDGVIANPNAIDLRVLLAYHNLMLGHRDAARRHFERVAALDPSNEVARRMIATEQPPQPRAEPASVPSPRASGPAVLIPVPTRKRSASGSAAGTGGVSIDLGQPAPTPAARQTPPEAKPPG